MKVIGIDPAPVKNPTIFDGKNFEDTIPTNALKKYLSDLKNDHQDLLICWDAPLTSFSDAFMQKQKKNKDYDSNFYTRKIEYVIKYTLEENPPSGISTMPYGSCPHWTITQHCLGLPQLYDGYTAESLPFALITENNLPISGHHIVEVHPALALWAWLKNTQETGWHYKKDKEVFNNIKNSIRETLSLVTLPISNLDDIFNKIENDDHLDAFIAWALGALWLQDTNDIALIGNKESGALLLPKTPWSYELNNKITTDI
jgi:hypothetical protein